MQVRKIYTLKRGMAKQEKILFIRGRDGFFFNLMSYLYLMSAKNRSQFRHVSIKKFPFDFFIVNKTMIHIF